MCYIVPYSHTASANFSEISILHNYDYAINIFNKVEMKGSEFINKGPPRHW